MAILKNATEDQQRRALKHATPEKLLALDAAFEHWAHANQLPPNAEGWRIWLMMAGRGFGKTRAGGEWIFRLAEAKPKSRIALVGATIADARSIMVEGVSGLLTIARRFRRRLRWEPSLSRLSWPNGSEAQLFSGDNGDGLRGPEHDFAWVLTFEVVADAVAPTAGQILFDSSSGAIADVGGRSIGGYACYGASIKAAVKPLADCCAIDLLDDGLQLKSASSAVLPISDLDLGYTADGQPPSKIQREQVPVRDVPTSLRLSYYDPALDYQAGESRASTGEQDGKEERIELPAVVDASVAKSLVEEAMARAWARRDRLTLRLPPARLDLEPGARLEVPLSPSRWKVESCTIDSFVVVAELRPCRPTGLTLVADSGRIASNPDVVAGELTLALFETPAALSLPNAPSVMLAASSPTAGWKSRGVEVSVGNQGSVHRTPTRKSKLGRALSVLASSDDPAISVEVELIDASQWLASCDDDALAEGANAAILGREIVQFGDAVPTGPGRFRLSRLLRGRDRTGSAMAGHTTDEWFVVIEADALRVIELPSWAIGAQATATPIGAGAGAGAAEAQATVGWGGLRPLSGSALLLDGLQVVGARGSAIASPTGGTTIDSEARSTIDQLLSALRQHGLIEF